MQLNADINGAIGMLLKVNTLSQSDLEHMNERTDILSPEKLEYRSNQGSILGIGKGRKGSWRGDQMADKFMEEDEKTALKLPPLPDGVNPKDLVPTKTVGLRNQWVISVGKAGE